MKNIFLALLLVVLPAGFYSCATVGQDVAGPAEPADTDTLEDRRSLSIWTRNIIPRSKRRSNRT